MSRSAARLTNRAPMPFVEDGSLAFDEVSTCASACTSFFSF